MFDKVQRYCDAKNLPYPPELCAYLAAVSKLRRERNGD